MIGPKKQGGGTWLAPGEISGPNLRLRRARRWARWLAGLVIAVAIAWGLLPADGTPDAAWLLAVGLIFWMFL